MSIPRAPLGHLVVTLLVLTGPGCLVAPEPVATETHAGDPLRDPCTGDHCVDDALGALLTAGWTGDIDALSAPATGRAGRMSWGYQVIDERGQRVSGSLPLLAKCGTSPERCFVQLFSRQRFEGVTAEAVVAALYGDWRWFWRNSASSGPRERPDLDDPATPFRPFEQSFHPLASLGDKVTVGTLLAEPERDAADPLPALDDAASPRFDRWDYRVPLALSGDFTGQAYLLVAERDGVVSLREVWPAMQITGAVRRLPAVAATLHLWAVSSRTPAALVGGDAFGLEGHSGWAGLADALEEGVHPLANQLPYPDRIHETVGDEHHLERDPSTGDWVIVGSSTVDVIDATPEDVRDALFGDIGCWWRHGAVTDLVPETDAAGRVIGLGYHLMPLLVGGVALAEVDEHMHAPEPLADAAGRRGFRIAIDLEGPDFRGPAHFDVLERADGRSEVRARFDWVRPQGRWGWNRFVATQAMNNHVRAQQGTMPLSLAGSGLPGLISLLERGEPANGSPSCR